MSSISPKATGVPYGGSRQKLILRSSVAWLLHVFWSDRCRLDIPLVIGAKWAGMLLEPVEE